MGPVAFGMTGVAVDHAQRLPVEHISVNSALVSRDMDIGTAKPDIATLARAPHHLAYIIAPPPRPIPPPPSATMRCA